jgi:glucose-6-phosphate isomerase
MTDLLAFDGTHLGKAPSRADAEAALAKLDEAQPEFLHLHRDDDVARRCADHAARLPDWVDDIVVLGIGGSALAGQALVGALGAGSPRGVHFLDTIDPDAVERALAGWDLAHTLFNVISKSGRTVETQALLDLVWDRMNRELGPHRARERVIVTTDDAPNPLREFSRKEGLVTFDLPPRLGGRFTVFTAVGLLPAAWAGVDVLGLLAGARAIAPRLVERESPALASAAAAAAANRPLLVLWPYVEALVDSCEWARQLWAEGTCKQGKGISTVTARAAAGQHAELQAFADGPPIHQIRFFRLAEPLDGRLAQLSEAGLRATSELLAKKGCPSATLSLPRLDAHSVGQLLLFWQVETVLAAWLVGVDPFGEPAVDESKALTSSYLDRPLRS